MVLRVSLVAVTQPTVTQPITGPSVNQSVPQIIGLIRLSVRQNPRAQEGANQPISHARRFSALIKGKRVETRTLFR